MDELVGSENRQVWTRSRALTRRNPEQLRRLLKAGDWRVVLPGVYAPGDLELDAEQWAFAAVLSSGGEANTRERAVALACGRTSARFWKLPVPEHDTTLDVHRSGGMSSLAAGPGWPEVRRHRLELRGADYGRLPSGLWITSPVRTALDCSRLLEPLPFLDLLQAGLEQGTFTLHELEHLVRERTGVPGCIAFREAVREVQQSRAA